jgi:hypothetical protein
MKATPLPFFGLPNSEADGVRALTGSLRGFAPKAGYHRGEGFELNPFPQEPERKRRGPKIR